MTTQVTTYTFETALADAAIELVDDFAKIAQLPAKDRVEAIREFNTKQTAIANDKVASFEKAAKGIRDKRNEMETVYKTKVTEMFDKGWDGSPELAQGLIALAKVDTSVRALTIQVTVHRESKTTGEGDNAKTVEVISLGSPVATFGTRLPAKGRPGTNGSGGGRKRPMIVDGTTYESGKAAGKAVLNEDLQSNWDAIAKKITNAGHTVSEPTA